MSTTDVATGEDWSEAEVREAVSDYLAMLLAESAGTPYSKTDHRRVLLSRLRAGRSASAVEFKHQNISAAMIDLGLPYIKGYRPRGNYQRAISDEIRSQLGLQPALLGALVAGHTIQRTTNAAFVTTPKPRRRQITGTVRVGTIDYEALQAENRRLGRLGEELVVDLEKDRLTKLGRADLARGVRWVAAIDGDGLGYDVLSHEPDAGLLHIEVKTTRLDAETPFYLSSAELAFAREHQETYRIYRVFDVEAEPKIFVIRGPLDEVLELSAVTFKARLALAE